MLYGKQLNGTIFQKSVQLLAHVDDIDIIGRTNRDVTAAFSAIEREFIKMGHEGRTKSTTSKDMRLIVSQITVDIYALEFIYLGSALGSLLSTSAAMVSVGNWVAGTSLVRLN